MKLSVLSVSKFVVRVLYHECIHQFLICNGCHPTDKVIVMGDINNFYVNTIPSSLGISIDGIEYDTQYYEYDY